MACSQVRRAVSKNFDIHEAITECAQWVEQFGGHKYAAGLSIKAENFDAFSEQFESVVVRDIQEASLLPEVEYDLDISLHSPYAQVSWILINQMSPFRTWKSHCLFSTPRSCARITVRGY